MAAPKHKFYKSRHNDAIYPAMSNPAGVEDEHPDDWTPATQAEIDAHIAANKEIRAAQLAKAMGEKPDDAYTETAPVATGGSIQLAEDDEPEAPVVTAPPTAPAPTPIVGSGSALGNIPPGPPAS